MTREKVFSSTWVGFLAAPILLALLLFLTARFTTKLLIHAFQIAVQGGYRLLHRGDVLFQAGRFLSFLVHAQDFVDAFHIQRIPSVLLTVSEPHDLPEDIRLLQRGCSFFGEERPFDLRYVLQRFQIRFEFVIQTTLKSAALT